MKLIIKKQVDAPLYSLILLDDDLCSVSHSDCSYKTLRAIVRSSAFSSADHMRDHLFGSPMWMKKLGFWKPVGVNRTYNEYAQRFKEVAVAVYQRAVSQRVRVVYPYTSPFSWAEAVVVLNED